MIFHSGHQQGFGSVVMSRNVITTLIGAGRTNLELRFSEDSINQGIANLVADDLCSDEDKRELISFLQNAYTNNN